jgi:hypothetical protein
MLVHPFFFFSPMDFHKSLDLGFEGFCEGVHVLTGIFIPKADAQGAFGLCIGESEGKECRGGLFGDRRSGQTPP